MNKLFERMYNSGVKKVINLNQSQSYRILQKSHSENDGLQHTTMFPKLGRKSITINNSQLQFISNGNNNPSSKSPSETKANFKFHSETEAIINEQINAEFKAFYYYLSMASYFGRVDVSLPGCESFFMQMHYEEHDHALKLMSYVKLRGGSVFLCPIKPPEDAEWKSPLNAFQTALKLEMEVTEKLATVYSTAQKHGDLNTSDYITTYFMEDQMKSINEMARLVTILSGVGDESLARFIFDKELLQNYVLPQFNVFKSSKGFETTEESFKKFVKKNKTEKD